MHRKDTGDSGRTQELRESERRKPNGEQVETTNLVDQELELDDSSAALMLTVTLHARTAKANSQIGQRKLDRCMKNTMRTHSNLVFVSWLLSLNDIDVFSLHSPTGAGENTKPQLVSVRNKTGEPFLPSFFTCVSQHEGKNTQLSLGSLSIGLLR